VKLALMEEEPVPTSALFPPSPAPVPRLHRRPHTPPVLRFCLHPPTRRASTVTLAASDLDARSCITPPPLPARASATAGAVLPSHTPTRRALHVTVELGAAHRFSRPCYWRISGAPREGDGESVYLGLESGREMENRSTLSWRVFLSVFRSNP
jgi:hypothetical protein